jgi:hypothetical protein
MTMQFWVLPSSRRARMKLRNIGIAQETPWIERTRSRTVSCIGLMSSMLSTIGSITQMIGLADVADRGVAALEQPIVDRRLLGDQQRGEGQADEDADEFGAVAR